MSNELQVAHSLTEMSRWSGFSSAILLLLSGLAAFSSNDEFRSKSGKPVDFLFYYVLIAFSSFIIVLSLMTGIFGSWRDAWLTFYGSVVLFGALYAAVFVPTLVIALLRRKHRSIEKTKIDLFFKRAAVGMFILGSAFLVVQQFVEFFR